MELREAFRSVEDLRILWVMADNQINEKTVRFIDDLGLRERIRKAVRREETPRHVPARIVQVAAIPRTISSSSSKVKSMGLERVGFGFVKSSGVVVEALADLATQPSGGNHAPE